MKKKIIVILTFLIIAVIAAVVVHNRIVPDEFKVGEDQIALRIKMNTREDIGLLVFDYSLNGHEHGGGMSNADRSKIKHDDELIQVWEREELKGVTAPVKIKIRFRVITDYVDPNYENDYPEELTKYLDPIEWETDFGREYRITISGNSVDGYKLDFEK